MSILKKFFSSIFTRSFLQILFGVIGFSMICGQISSQWFDFGENIWNARIYAILGILSISLSISLTADTVIKVLRRGISSLVILMITMFIVGGGFIISDALNGTEYTMGNIWIAFDAVSGGLGLDFIMIVNSVPTILAVVTIGITILMLFYSEDAGQIMQVIIEGGVALTFLIIFHMFWT